MKFMRKYCLTALAVVVAVSMATACVDTKKDTEEVSRATASAKPLAPPDDETLITPATDDEPTQVPLSSIESLNTEEEVLPMLEGTAMTEEEITIPDDVAATAETMEKFGQ